MNRTSRNSCSAAAPRIARQAAPPRPRLHCAAFVVRLAVLLLAVGSATGCASLQPKAFAGASPSFDPVAWFTGPTRSWGVIENRAGEPKSRFHTLLVGRPDGNGDGIVLTQDFTFDSGRQQQRIWHLKRTGAHRYQATAADVIGPAVGEAFGNAFHWSYTLQLKPGNPLSRVHVNDWMYLTSDDTLINRVVMSRLGVTLVQTTEYFHRGHGPIASITQH